MLPLAAQYILFFYLCLSCFAQAFCHGNYLFVWLVDNFGFFARLLAFPNISAAFSYLHVEFERLVSCANSRSREARSLLRQPSLANFFYYALRAQQLLVAHTYFMQKPDKNGKRDSFWPRRVWDLSSTLNTLALVRLKNHFPQKFCRNY